MKHIITILLIWIVTVNFSEAQLVKISNLTPRKDVKGEIIDLHDGRMMQFGKRFYWYGTSYGKSTGFGKTNNFHCYSSTDLINWEKERELLPEKPEGVYYRPHVIYNEKTQKYILWYNWYPQLWDGKFAVATSDTPEGPYTIVNEDVQVFYSSDGVGDFGLFVDTDQTAYITYNTIDGHKCSIEKLTADYLSSTMENGGFLTTGCEAGAIFKRGNTYYMLTDYTCCFCTQGSGARVYTSDNPMKGYKLRNNINRHPGTPATSLIDGIKSPNLYTTLNREKDGTFPAIQIDLLEKKEINEITVYQFTGNRAGICGDTLATRVHDPIYPLELSMQILTDRNEWEAIRVTGSIRKTAVYNIITIRPDSKAETSSIRLLAENSYPYNELFINDIEVLHREKNILKSMAAGAYINNQPPDRTLPVIPAQQTSILTLTSPEGPKYIWMGDLWGSASDDIKGHDYQYWGAPLEFYENGDIRPIRWIDEWEIHLEL